MGQSKPMGINKTTYQDIQDKISDDQFKFDVNQNIQNLKLSHDLNCKSISDLSSTFDCFKVECKRKNDEISTLTTFSLKEFRQFIGDIQTSLNNMKEEIKQIKLDIQVRVKQTDFKERNDIVENLFSGMRSRRETDLDDITRESNRLKQDFECRIGKMKEEILSIPSELPTLKKLFDQKVELVELNGQNSVLRSSNNEKQIMLVERKIENLYQLVKKLELNIEEKK